MNFSEAVGIKRVRYIFLVFMLLFSLCIVRIISIQKSPLSQVADNQFEKTVRLAETRGYIYDRNRLPLVNAEKKENTVILVTQENKSLVENTTGKKNIKNGLCIISESTNINQNNDYIRSFYTVSRYSETPLCSHITGYINSDGKGVCGIEKAFDKILDDAGGELVLKFNAEAQGNALAGGGLEIINDNFDSPGGIVLTIDKNIQEITQNAMAESGIVCGAAVVINTNTFEIEAICSVPYYDPNDIAASLSDNNLPFVNRAFSSFPVGSVFKPIVAAAALENGMSIMHSTECKGFLDIGGNTFRCYNSNVHGTVDLNSAVEKSCNCFFIETGLDTGAENIIKTAEKFGFGKEIRFCSTLVSECGNLPHFKSILSDPQLANLCFGQGELLATPVQIAAAYAVFANGGIYKTPVMMKTLINNNGEEYAYYKNENEVIAVKKKTAEMINACLYNNMLNGTGVNAAPYNTSSAGKTATAQTGRYDDNGQEILCTWFAGFFPYEKPQYAVVVMNEKGSTASSDCAPVFKNIAERITEYLNGQKES